MLAQFQLLLLLQCTVIFLLSRLPFSHCLIVWNKFTCWKIYHFKCLLLCNKFSFLVAVVSTSINMFFFIMRISHVFALFLQVKYYQRIAVWFNLLNEAVRDTVIEAEKNKQATRVRIPQNVALNFTRMPLGKVGISFFYLQLWVKKKPGEYYVL